VVSKQLRDYYKYNPDKCGSDKCTHDHHKKNNQQQQQRQHCCGFNLIEHGVGHADLDRLLKIPQSLDFVLELIRAEQPGDYKKDSWALSEQEQVAIVPVLKEQGSELFKKKLYSEACEKYKEAVGHVEQLMLKEKPHDVDWNRLNEQKMPLLLNYAMCKFNMNEFYECIEHTTAILESQPANVKAMFRRAKAYAAVWSFAEARADFAKCVELDASLLAEVNAQLASLKKAQEIHEKEEKDKFRGKLFS
jgi:AH receptor-interacting protein